jgi:RimJ/RimL family protein N-acetyltransferase
MAFTQLETERLIIKPYTLDDLQARHQLVNEAFGETSLEDTQRWLSWTVANYRELSELYQPPYGDYAIALKSGELIGSVGLVQTIVPWSVFDEPPPGEPYLVTPEFGLYWAILPAHQGKGYATEATNAFVGYLFNDMLYKRVVATTDHDNTASQKVMEKIGMTIRKNPGEDPFWFEVVGVLDHPKAR